MLAVSPTTFNPFRSFTTPTTIPQMTALFNGALAGAATLATAVATGFTAHIFPITAGIVLAVALFVLYKKVYLHPAPAAGGANHDAGAQPASPRTAAEGLKRNEARVILTASNLPELRSYNKSTQYKTHALPEKIVSVDGKYFCRFEKDTDSFNTTDQYPILGWINGKDNKNVYLVVAKPSLPRPVSPAPTPVK